MTGKLFCLLLIFILDYGFVVNAVSFQEDTFITEKEAKILFKFRERVRPKLPHKYMEESIFLIKWLRAQNFDVDAAEKMLLAHVKWRAENKMDTIDEENWEDMKHDFEWNGDGVDREGRPLVQIIIKEWDIRQGVITGKRARLIRWIYKYFEDATKLVRKYQSEGKNVTRFSLVLDAEGFNPVNHGCPLCIPIYMTIVNAYEQQYPGAIDNVHVVNTPEFFRTIIRLLWPLLSQDTRKALKLHGTDHKAWRRTLSKTIDESQLLPAFGGYLKTE